LKDIEAEYVLADAAYHSKSNIEAVKDMGAEPVIAPNPRRSGKKRRLKHGRLLRAKRYLVEQFNGLIKNHVLKGCWVRPKGIIKKASMVTAALIGLIATAVKSVKSILQGEPSLSCELLLGLAQRQIDTVLHGKRKADGEAELNQPSLTEDIADKPQKLNCAYLYHNCLIYCVRK
jgi:hypothetical protein